MATKESRLQEEIGVLINELLEMREKTETLEKKISQYESSGATLDGSRDSSGKAGAGTSATPGDPNAHPLNPGGEGNSKPTGGKAKQGLLKVSDHDTDRLVNDLVLQLDPRLVQDELPGIATHLLFMCLLYADEIASPALMQGLLAKTMSGIKEVVMHNSNDMNLVAFWITNTYRLLTNMKQFSGEKEFKVLNLKSQRTFKNFDLQQYRSVLSDLLVQIYRTVVKQIEHKLLPLCIPGILEHESIPGMGGPPSDSPKRKTVDKGRTASVQTIIELLNSVNRHLTRQCVEPALVRQIFTQLFYSMNARLVSFSVPLCGRAVTLIY